MTESQEYDVFLSHSSKDKPAVERIADRLRAEEGIQPFLDKWHLPPGAPWQEELKVALRSSASVAVFIGPNGSGPWQDEELRLALDRAARSKDDFRVIPVILPTADTSAVDEFLAQRTWVDFSAGLDDAEAMKRLAAGVRGEAFTTEAFSLPDEPVPYRGLFRFEAKDQRFFFGRDDDIERLIHKVEESAFVAVVGASGSGKSSLVRAGLLPNLDARIRVPQPGAWVTLTCLPGHDPFKSLAQQVATLSPTPGSLTEIDALAERFRTTDTGLIDALSALTAAAPAPVLLFIDQFEELFTVARDSSQTPAGDRAMRARFVANLASTAADSKGFVKIVMTMRADFSGEALSVAGLADLLQDHEVKLGALIGDKLREAIVRPAHECGAIFEKGLVARIMDQVDGQPGSLPLLQHALYELWTERRGPWLTNDAFESTGGVVRALSKRAQEVYDGFTKGQQRAARQVFVRLTQFGDGVPDTRRRAGLAELGADDPDVRSVLDALSGEAARLIVIEGDTAEVAHEALLRNWDTLRGWLDGDRVDHRVHRDLTEAAEKWAQRERDTSSLYQGVDLEEAKRLRTARSDDLNALEREFIGASQTFADRELAAATAQAASLQRRLIVAGVALLIAVALAVTSVAFATRARTAQQRADDRTAEALEATSRAEQSETVAQSALQDAQESESEAKDAREQAVLAARESERLGTEATARALAASSTEVLDRDPALAALLALEADRTASIPEAEGALFRVNASPWLRTLSRGFGASSVFDPSGTRVLTAGPDGVFLWDVRGGEPDVISPDAATSAEFDQTGRLAVIASSTGVWVWDLRGTRDPVQLTAEYFPNVRFSRDGARVVGSGYTGSVGIGGSGPGVVVWSVAGDAPPVTITTTPMVSAGFSPDGNQVLTAGTSGASLWKADGSEPPEVVTADPVVAANFDPSGQRIVTIRDVAFGDVGPGVVVWDAAGNAVTIATDDVTSAEFGLDGSQVVTAGPAGVTVRDAAGVASPIVLTTTSSYRATMSSDGSMVLSRGAAGVTLWDATGTNSSTTLTDEPTSAAAVDEGGERLVTLGWDIAGDGGAGPVTRLSADMVVRDVDRGSRWTLLTDTLDAAIISRDGSRAVTLGDTGVTAWNLDAPGEGTVLSTDATYAAAISADGGRVVAGGYWGLRVWDTDGAVEGRVLSDLDTRSVAISQDGSTVVSTSLDGDAVVWDLDGGSDPVQLTADQAFSVLLSDDGTVAVTKGGSGVVVHWIETGESVTLDDRAGLGVAINADGSRIVTTDLTSVKVWSMGSAPTAVAINTVGDTLVATAIDPSGARIVVVGLAGTTLWSADGQRIAILSRDALSSAEFSGDGSRIIGVGPNGVRVWKVSSTEMRAEVDRRVGSHTFSDQECTVYRIEPCPAG
ncbi:MAG: TIR domain-containing protein [Ilumatobacteraceae bacterium]